MRTWLRDFTSQIAAYACIGGFGVIGLWLASLTPMIAVFAPFSYVIAALLTAIVAAIVFALLGRAKREWWPSAPALEHPVASSPDTPPDHAAAVDVARLRVRIAALEEMNKAIVDDYQRMSGLEARSTDALDGLKLAIQAENRSLRTNTEKIQEQVTALAAQVSLNADRADTQVRSIYDALGAVYHRERLQELARYIEAGGRELSAPTEHRTRYNREEWEQWEAKERGWRSILKAWCELAACYAEGIDQKVMTISEDQYRQTGVAQPDQFPGEGFIAYKAFCARFKNWHNWQVEAVRAVHQVAFNGGTAGSRSIFPGCGEMEELGGRATL